MGPANFWARLVDGVAISRASSTIFATLGTALVSLLVIPVLEIVYSLLFGADLHSTQLLRTAYVATCVSFTSAICSGMVSRVATDRHLGVFQEVHSWRRFDAAYWLAAALVPVIFATTTAVIALLGVRLVAWGQVGHPDLASLLGLFGLSLVCGVLLGVGAGGIGVDLSDPYAGANTVTALLPIFTGVIVPVKYYPAWLVWFSYVTPLARCFNQPALVLNPAAALMDLVVAAAWALVGVGLVWHAMKRLRQGLRREAL